MPPDAYDSTPCPDSLAQPLPRDVPCRCGYNLRGLPPSGRCPECGLEVIAVLVASAGAASAVAPVDPRWARAMRNAAVLAMAADILRSAVPFITLSLFPFAYDSGFGGGSYLFHSVVCVWWVLLWYAALKLTKSEEAASSTLPERMVTWALRIIATLYMLLPFAATLLVEQPTRRGPTTLHVIVRASTMLLAALFFLRVRDVCRRLGGEAVAGQAALAALLLPFVMWSSRSWSNWRNGFAFLAPFGGVPSYQFGDTVRLWSFVNSFPNDVGSAMAAASNTAIATGCWLVMIRLTVIAWRAGRA